MLKLTIESGPAKGKTAEIPPEGLSVGRSSQNDLAIPDAQLSRHHCKLYFAEGKLFVTDLASANGTAVNNTPVDGDAAIVSHGDKIVIGDTVIAIADPAAPPVAAGPRLPDFGAAATPAGTKPIDLGFDSGTSGGADTAKHPLNKKSVLMLAGAFIVVVCLLLLVKHLLSGTPESAKTMSFATVAPDTLEIRYSETEGSGANIFRYELALGPDGRLTVSIKDLAQGREIPSKTSEKPLDTGQIRDLANKVQRERFHDLDDKYEGEPRANTWSERRLTIIVNNEAKTVAAINKQPPDELMSLIEDIKVVARTELALFTIEFSLEQLLELSKNELVLGDKLFDERDIRLENLHRSIRAYKSSIAYLETIEPKPEFYDHAVEGKNNAEKEFALIWVKRNGDAEIAVRTRDWVSAQRTLRDLLEMVPDRTDDRYKDVARRLLEVEGKLNTTKGR